nr:hypothetical protein BgiMline_033049 [Biomphalaria glabrata]
MTSNITAAPREKKVKKLEDSNLGPQNHPHRIAVTRCKLNFLTNTPKDNQQILHQNTFNRKVSMLKPRGTSIPHSGTNIPHAGTNIPHAGNSIPHAGNSIPHSG